jgi:hypothetical protein
MALLGSRVRDKTRAEAGKLTRPGGTQMAHVVTHPQNWSRTERAKTITRHEARSQLLWFAGIAAMSFLVPAVFSSLLDLQHDLYYLIYFAATIGGVGLYVARTGTDVLGTLTRRWKLSLAVGVVSTAFVVWSVLARIDSTPHPGGAYFAFEIAWRGVLYGMVDALLLTAFPGMVAWSLMGGVVAGWVRRVTYAGLTLALVITITAVYHLGFQDLRDREGIRNPEIGNTLISLPILASTNPLGSFLAHTSMHVAAVTHSYESEDRLPPQTFVDSDE